MTTPVDPGQLWHLYPPGEPQPVTVQYQGLQYGGEVVFSDHWDPEWGRRLEGDLYFRVVMLGTRRNVTSSDLQDSRIAVCIPGRGPWRERRLAGRELTALRETQALYLTQKDRETAFIRGYLRQQREELQTRLVAEEAARYARGQIESPTVFSTGIEEFFTGPEPAAWLEKLADALLSWAYPTLPIELPLLPRTVTPEDVPMIYEAIFASSEEDRIPLGEFGPALGLSTPQAPLTFDPAQCTVFRQIRAELANRGGDLPWNEIVIILAHAAGLTRPLATLYLLAFLYSEQPEAELVLAPDHRLTFRDGRPVRGGALTREFVPFLPWQSNYIAQIIVGMRLRRGEVSWNDALQYTSFLCQGLTEIEDSPTEVASQEQELLHALNEIKKDTDRARELLAVLGRTIPNPIEDQLRTSFDRLSEVSGGVGFETVYELARGSYGDPQILLEELDMLRRLLYLGASRSDIVGTKSYLEGAAAAAGHRQLSVDRSALLEQMSLPVLLAGVQSWPAVAAQVQEFKTRYRRAYITHHTFYQREVSQLLESLEDSHRKLHALSLLNSITELGEPVGVELDDRLNSLEQTMTLCHLSPQDIPLQENPTCASCRLALGEVPPTQEQSRFDRDLRRALGEQNRRLSRALVDRILDDRVDQKLENFLKIVQASDLAALSNTLDYELALFIGQLLREA